MNEILRTAPHNPPHWFKAHATYMLTAAIYQRRPLMHAPERKTEWRQAFFTAAGLYRWQIIAWVVLHDHYHEIVVAPEQALSLSKFVGSYHKFTARLWNEQDQAPGRKVWWNYWDTCIRDQHEYLHRLGYVFWNPVKHGLVETPEGYLFSNYLEVLNRHGFIEFTGIEEVNDVPEW